MDYIDFITRVLTNSSKIANTSFGKVTSSTKPEDNNQVLTQTDIEIGKYITDEIQRVFPNHNIIDEEAGPIDKLSEFSWVIDPIDGTSNFASGIPTYGIALGLLEAAIPIAGGIILPYFNELYTAQKGKGTFCEGKKIQVTSEPNLTKTLFAYGIDSHIENPDLTEAEIKVIQKLIPHIRNLRTSNSSFDIIQVAKGSYGGILNKTSKIWDNVAAQILIEEAGGIYTDYDGKKIDYSNPLSKIDNNFTFCAASPTLHYAVQNIINN